MSTFGRIYRVSTFGESHSPGVGCTVEGFPANMRVDKDAIQKALNRRRPGQHSLTTPRNELDQVEILCGIENDLTLGSPLAFLVRNQDFRKNDYSEMEQIPRPGHADYTYLLKYGIKASSGGGRSSARETIGRVIAGALADVYLEGHLSMRIFSFVSSVGDIAVPAHVLDSYASDSENTTKARIDELGRFKVFHSKREEQTDNIYQNVDSGEFLNSQGEKILCDESVLQHIDEVNIRCPHAQSAVRMIELIQKTKENNDSIGGTIFAVIVNPPPGLGEPCFDKLPAQLAHAMMSIPATKGFEFGSGFEGSKMNGSSHNDIFHPKNTQGITSDKSLGVELTTKTNNAGGTLGGISSGSNIYFKVAFKPVSTIGVAQQTCTLQGKETVLEAKGRHDPCVLPRAPPVVDAMASMVIMDAILMQATHQTTTKWQEI